MAAEANIGLSNPHIASGIAAMLYPKAQPRLVLIVCIVAREILIAEIADFMLDCRSTMSAELAATSVPSPMAILK